MASKPYPRYRVSEALTPDSIVAIVQIRTGPGLPWMGVIRNGKPMIFNHVHEAKAALADLKSSVKNTL